MVGFIWDLELGEWGSDNTVYYEIWEGRNLASYPGIRGRGKTKMIGYCCNVA